MEETGSFEVLVLTCKAIHPDIPEDRYNKLGCAIYILAFEKNLLSFNLATIFCHFILQFALLSKDIMDVIILQFTVKLSLII